MTDLTSDPKFVQEPLRWRNWPRLQALSWSPSSGLQRGLVLILLFSLLLLGLEIYQATAVVPALRPSRSFDVVSTAYSFVQAMQDAETGQRGFLITGDENYLMLYEAGVESAPIKLDELRQLTRHDAKQQRHVGILTALPPSAQLLLSGNDFSGYFGRSF